MPNRDPFPVRCVHARQLIVLAIRLAADRAGFSIGCQTGEDADMAAQIENEVIGRKPPRRTRALFAHPLQDELLVCAGSQEHQRSNPCRSNVGVSLHVTDGTRARCYVRNEF